MSKPALTYTRPIGRRALVHRSIISSRTRAVALMIIAAMTVPLVFIGGTARTKATTARTIRTVPPPASAPPERFVTHQDTPAAASVFFKTGILSRLYDSLKTPVPPAGFEAAKAPTLTERVTTSLATFASTKSAIRNPTSEIAAPPSPPPATVLFDFDDDGKADIGRWQGSNTRFEVRNSNGGSPTVTTIGSSSSIPAPGDFDGDGKTDAAVFDAGSWVIKKSSNGSTQNTSFGTSGDKPVAADYDGDGTTDIAIFRPSTSTWWILKSSDSNTISNTFGALGDIPVTGNWDGDAYADVAVFRPSNGTWYVSRSTAGSLTAAWVSGPMFLSRPTSMATTRPTSPSIVPRPVSGGS